jgi:hypothetical protein
MKKNRVSVDLTLNFEIEITDLKHWYLIDWVEFFMFTYC